MPSINQKNQMLSFYLLNIILKRICLNFCCCYVFSKEDTDIYAKFYQILKTNFSFEPKKITMDFTLANIKAIPIVFKDKEIMILTCLFHLL